MKQIVIYCFVVLIPALPAFLLFTALPSTGDVTGKLHGLEIKLGGAFAGYFAVIVLIFVHFDKLFPPPPPPSAYVWHLSGQVMGPSGEPIEPLDIKDFSFSPPWLQTMPGGNFKLTVPTDPQEGGGTAWPMLVISHEGFLPLRVPLTAVEQNPDTAASFGLFRDEEHRNISMQHITLQRAPPYQPTGQKLKQISGPKPKASPHIARKENR